jgi:hypothetical protein
MDTLPNIADLSLFATRSPANAGAVLELEDVDGNTSAHTLNILGTDSDNFQRAQFKSKQAVIAKMKDGKEATFDEATDMARELVASLISGWSFTDPNGEPVPCTKANVVAFLKEAPQIQEQIDRVATDRKLFTKGKPTTSVQPSEKNSPSQKPKLARTKQHAKS